MLLAESVTWYLTRAGGVMAFALLTVAVLIGVGLGGKARLERWPRFALTDVHRFAGLLAGSFVALHVLVLLVDDYMPFSVLELVVPGTSGYRPLATAIGVVCAELMLALAVTNRYRQRLPYRLWRRAHYLSFAVWLLALVHGITAGSDSTSGWAAAVYGIAGASVAGLTTWRLVTASRSRHAGSRATARPGSPTAGHSPVPRSETEAA